MEKGYFRNSQEDFYKGPYLNVFKKQSGVMDFPDFSPLSSLREEFRLEDYIQPHYKESYRLAIDCLVQDGRNGYHDFLKGEQIGSFLSEDEILFITANAEQLPSQNHTEEVTSLPDTHSSSGTYWPTHSDVETPNLDLGWPEVLHENPQTNIDLLFHPPRLNNLTIKEVIRKHVQDARQVIAIVMDVFTDVDIFKEVVDASIRGVPVYVLLDHFHLKSFLKMAENQDVKLQQLRNMRVRTVKGQDYLCRSGDKFHGAMEQKFVLVDCCTAIYGSYSFTWSFEKINLSMVQVITGHLVKSYDEEFRTLYARSTAPADLSPPEGLFQHNRRHGQQSLPKSYSAGPFAKTEQRDQLKESLDTVYKKTCERKLGTWDLKERLLEEESNTFEPLIGNDISLRGQIPQFHQFQSAEAMNFLKRHSYAGEAQNTYTPRNIRQRASNWNVSRDAGHGQSNYNTDCYLQVPQMYRGQNMRQSYNGNDKQFLSMQQDIPTLENTSKSFMRTWRIESYLKNPDAPLAESCDYLDQFESQDKPNSFMQGRMRNSFVFRSTIPEQIEPHGHANTSTVVGPLAAPNAPLHYSSMQWNPAVSAENRANTDEFMLKRQSLQILDDIHSNTGFGSGRNSYHLGYASLGRAKRGQVITNPDMLTDSWHKRHSVADPHSNNELTHDSLGHMSGPFAQVNRSTAETSAQNGGYGLNLNEDQRSVSHYDVKSIADTTRTHIWQKPPSRTVSAAALDLNSKDLKNKTNSTGSQHFLKKSSNKIKSLLNIPEKKEDSIRTTQSPSLTSAGSTDTITAEEEEEKPAYGGQKLHQNKTSSRFSSERHKSSAEEDHLKSSKPRFKTEELPHSLSSSPPKTTTPKKPSIHDKSLRSGAENRLYSRFEPFCSFERKQPPLTNSAHLHSQEKTKSLPKGEATVQHSAARAARGHHENKLEKFIHRVGNLIHKNK
ncbi:protein FAM83B [Melanotaenia boesemani]|uniref:protein FAM83B n=1 Tax=Melanotaenia boesemani TaxID=1250792 RepID=UPI001C043872|nr:protein FAM83B [Melanotaenia boesemani]